MRRHVRFMAAVVGAALTAAALSGAPAATGAVAPEPAALPQATTTTARIVAVGDIAKYGGSQWRTAARISAIAPWRVLALGDLAYPDGSAANFSAYYAPTYGRFRSITWPLPGNHEYRTADAAGFRSYFGIPAGAPTWFAHRAGAWLVIGLDSEKVGSAAQMTFLQDTLAANDGVPTVVAWHRARYSLGQHGDAVDTQPLWAVVAADTDVRIALWGHDHDYERMKVPLAGREGIQAFVVGTGGAELRPFSTRTRAWSWKRISGRYGVLHLRLRADGWSWSFVRGDGVTADAGTRYL